MNATPVRPTFFDGIVYDILGEKDVDSAVRCVARTFAMGDPVSRAAGLTTGDLETFIDIFLKKSLVSDRLSVVARDDENGEVVGAVLMTDLLAEGPGNVDALPPRLLPVIAMIDELDGKYVSDHNPGPGEVLHVLMAGVDEGHSNKGIGFQMLIKGYEIARWRGFHRAVAEITGAASQHVAEKYGARTLYRLAYGSFEHRGSRPFESITECETCNLMCVDI